MSGLDGIIEQGVRKRVEHIRDLQTRVAELQEQRLMTLMTQNAATEFGERHGFAEIGSIADFQARVPISRATDYDEAWKRIGRGERHVLFKDPVDSYGLSSGTTGEPKKVPLTKALVRSLKRAVGYTTASYIDRSGNLDLLKGYALQMAAPPRLATNEADGKPIGYITGIISAARTYPFHNIGIPKEEVLNLEDWEEKYRIVEERHAHLDVRMVFGIPSYVLGLLRRLAAKTETGDLTPLWPAFSLAVTSGVSLASYRPKLEALVPNAELVEMYLCTEASIAFQPGAEPGMMPMVEDLFLEFVPEEEWEDDRPTRLTLSQVEPDVRYVVLITTPSGLYAYAPGDVVRFLQTDPPRMLVEGRYGNVLNLAAEKLDGTQAAQALDRAGIAWEAFSVCPAADGAVGHEWVVEFVGAPPEGAGEAIDAALRAINPLYAHMREGDLLMEGPCITPVAQGTFADALRHRPGQGKVLRIYQDRTVRDELCERARILRGDG
ncbi:MAG: GH3 auxin-responsive promoter family protein [Planctomycetota bacterium]